MHLRAFAIGTAIGGIPAALMYLSVPAYAHYIQWQLQHPVILIPALLIGIAVGWLAD